MHQRNDVTKDRKRHMERRQWVWHGEWPAQMGGNKSFDSRLQNKMMPPGNNLGTNNETGGVS